jgi:phosphatidylglycerol---prolipoprotein diacylglyceryl transferase
MNVITFPGLNLQFNINRVALSIGGISIYWYAILMTSAFAISLLIYKLKNGKFEIKFSDILDLALLVIPISIVFARLYYILFNLEYYVANPTQIFNLRSGGLAIYGGIIGGAVTCYIFCKKRKIDLLDLLDYIVPCLALRTINR